MSKETYVTIWDDQTFSITRARNLDELFGYLDDEGDPSYPTVTTHRLPKGWRCIRQDSLTRRLSVVRRDDIEVDVVESLPLVNFENEGDAQDRLPEGL